MQLRTTVSLVPLILVTMAASALAQQPPSEPPVRGYLIAGAGASLHPRTATTFSAELAEHVHPDVQVFVGMAYYYDLISREARDQVADVGRALTEVSGELWDFHARDRGLSFTVGGKYLVPTGTAVRPYVGGGVGALNLRRSIRERDLGGVTEEFLADFGTADGVVDVTRSSTTRPMGDLRVGLNVAVGRAYFDVGYRFRKAFHNVNRAFELSQVGAGVGIRF